MHISSPSQRFNNYRNYNNYHIHPFEPQAGVGDTYFILHRAILVMRIYDTRAKYTRLHRGYNLAIRLYMNFCTAF